MVLHLVSSAEIGKLLSTALKEVTLKVFLGCLRLRKPKPVGAKIPQGARRLEPVRGRIIRQFHHHHHRKLQNPLSLG